MNDFDYDVMQKKRIAHNAARMKRGRKSKKCTLPSDNLTAAQWKRRNGPVNTYSLNLPMDWGTFKSLPVDIQQSYIDILQSRFNVTAATIGNDLFGKTPAALRAHMDKNGIKYAQMKGRNMPPDEREIWERWLTTEKCESAQESVVEPEIEEEPAFVVLDPLEEIKPLTLDELSAVFTGVFSPVAFLDWISRLPIPEESVRIKVEVTRE